MQAPRQLEFATDGPGPEVTCGFRSAEFFAGIGLVRKAIEAEGFTVVFANDISPMKRKVYEANFSGRDFLLGDIRDIKGSDIPPIDLATASFPCTDLSLAGNRAGLAGNESGLFWEFARVLQEMGQNRPQSILLENVPGFATSHSGADLLSALKRLNELGYWCDVLTANASWFVPQSRLRLFIVGGRRPLAESTQPLTSDVRPPALVALLNRFKGVRLQAMPLSKPLSVATTLADVVEGMAKTDERWWGATRHQAFLSSLSPIQDLRLRSLRSSTQISWAAAYRRTRGGRAVWEIRPDAISGCLRTARGGSSKQAIVEAGNNDVRIRWMTAREYARLQGAPDDFRIDVVSPGQALFGFGDAVCVPVIQWLTRAYLRPLVEGSLPDQIESESVALG